MGSEAVRVVLLVIDPRLRWFATATAWAIFPIAVLGLLSVGTLRPFFYCAALMIFAVSMGLRWASRKRYSGTVTASEQGLSYREEIVLRADELATAGYGATKQGRCLTLFDVDHRPRAQLYVGEAFADELLTELRPGMRAEAVDFAGVSRAAISPARLFVLVAYSVFMICLWISTTDGSLADLLILMAIVPAAALVLIRSRIRVGADGVSIRWLGRERFLSYRELDEIEDLPNGVVLHHRGERVRVLTMDSKEPDLLNRGDALKRAIRHAITLHQEGGIAELTSLLERGEREAEAWITQLESLGPSEGYRQVSVTPHALWSILEDAAVETSARAGAGFLLSQRELNDDARTRVRKSAASAASAQLREVFDVIAEGGDVGRALKRIAG